MREGPPIRSIAATYYYLVVELVALYSRVILTIRCPLLCRYDGGCRCGRGASRPQRGRPQQQGGAVSAGKGPDTNGAQELPKATRARNRIAHP
eukprot:COSAG06_NODE_874_length_11831_cov_217.383396_5_plen_93_part_00